MRSIDKTNSIEFKYRLLSRFKIVQLTIFFYNIATVLKSIICEKERKQRHTAKQNDSVHR